MKRYSTLSIAIAVGAMLMAAAGPVQPKIESRKAPVQTRDGLKFRDLNRNGALDRYEDWRLPVDQRVADLLSKMTVEEKAGLMIHSSLAGFTGPNGEVLGLPAAGGRADAADAAGRLPAIARSRAGESQQRRTDGLGQSRRS